MRNHNVLGTIPAVLRVLTAASTELAGRGGEHAVGFPRLDKHCSMEKVIQYDTFDLPGCGGKDLSHSALHTRSIIGFPIHNFFLSSLFFSWVLHRTE